MISGLDDGWWKGGGRRVGTIVLRELWFWVRGEREYGRECHGVGCSDGESALILVGRRETTRWLRNVYSW